MKKTLLLLAFTATLLSCKNETKSEDSKEISVVKDNLATSEKIANANGFENFDSVEEINFTFNVKVGDSLRSSRAWTWNPKQNKVAMTENDSTATYIKGSNNLSEEDKALDSKFVNDSYWLLFPYQLVWSDANFKDEKNAIAPISKEKMNKLIVSYNADGGYTPGDTYDVYYDNDFMIKEWVYKAAGGGREMATTWEDYETFKDLKISKMHKSEDGSFQLYFTDISVK